MYLLILCDIFVLKSVITPSERVTRTSSHLFLDKEIIQFQRSNCSLIKKELKRKEMQSPCGKKKINKKYVKQTNRLNG